MVMQKLNVNQMVLFLLFQDLKPKMILLIASSLMNIFGLELMILNKKEVLLELMEVTYHIQIGNLLSQTIIMIRMGSQFRAIVTMGFGLTRTLTPNTNSFVQFILKVSFFHLNCIGHVYHNKGLSLKFHFQKSF